MFKIEKNKCCGCEACVQRCPVNCIHMFPDSEGFRYPVIEEQRCTHCGLCQRVCPSQIFKKEQFPLQVYNVINKNDNVRFHSSSGGVFSLLAEKILGTGGVVFGVRFDEEWGAKLTYSDKIEDICYFRGSKYVQARVGSAYKLAKEFLDNGRKILFSGTPCQVSALCNFLGNKTYSNLYTIDIICHGVPSPMIWKDYLLTFQDKINSKISNINFRDKTTGWHNYSLSISAGSKLLYSAIHRDDPYMQSYLSKFNLRPSCFSCPVKSGRSGSDLTIGDFWGVEQISPKLDDDKGIGLLFVNSPKGLDLVSGINMHFNTMTLDQAILYNPSWHKQLDMPRYRPYFWSHYHGNLSSILEIIKRKQTPSRFHLMLFELKKKMLLLINK